MSTGLDTYIDNAISIFEDNLWVGFDNQFLGRSYRLTKSGNIQPHIYDETAKNKKYKEVFASNKHDSIVHFDVETNGEMVGNSQQLLNVNILFAVNLSSIYGDDVRSVEQCKKDISEVLQYTSFKAIDYVDQLPAYTDIYGLTIDQLDKFNMQPFYIVRFETTIMAGLGNCETTTQVIKRPLTISIEGDGETYPAPGTYQIENGESVQLLTAPNKDSEFVEWDYGTSQDTEPVQNFIMTGLVNAVARFRIIVMEYYLKSILGLSSDIITDGTNWFYKNEGTGEIPATNTQINDTQVLTLDGSSWINLPLDSGNIKQGDTIEFTYKRNGLAPTTFHPIYTRFNTSNLGFQIYVLNSGSFIGIYTDAANTFNYTVPADLKNYRIELGASTATLFVDDIEIETLSGITFYDIPAANVHKIGNHVGAYTKGNLSHFKSIDFNYHFQETNGVSIKDLSGDSNAGILIGANQAVAWGTKSDEAKPTLQINGYTQFESDTISGQFLYAEYDINGNPTSQAEAGYSIVREVSPYAGFGDTGNTLLFPDDVIINEVFDKYPSLAVLKNPNRVTFDNLNNIDLSVIDENDFTFERVNGVIKNILIKK